MDVKTILSLKGTDVTTGSPSMTLREVCTCLAENRIGAIVVTDASAAVVGIISERDIVKSVARSGPAVLDESAGSHMTSNVVTCTPQSTVHSVMETMTRGRFRHLPVVENGKLTGIVSIGDVVKHRMAEIEREAEEIRNYIATA
jgi:CBS domain-containing protein